MKYAIAPLLLLIPTLALAKIKKENFEGAIAEVYKTASGDDLYLYLFNPPGHDPAEDRRPAESSWLPPRPIQAFTRLPRKTQPERARRR